VITSCCTVSLSQCRRCVLRHKPNRLLLLLLLLLLVLSLLSDAAALHDGA